MFKKSQAVKILGLCLMLVLVMAVLAGCGDRPDTEGAVKAPETCTIVDHAGRNVTVPCEINKVFSTSPVGMILMYTLAPEKLVAWNFEISPECKEYLLPQYLQLPNLGGWYGNMSCNTEELLKINPDIIISIGVLNEASAPDADRIQQQVGIPVVLVDANLTEMDKTYNFMGELLGVKDRAEELAAYCRQTIDEVAEKTKLIPDEKRVRVYYAEGPSGLETDPQGSMHTQVLELVNGINVADVPIKGGMGMTPVSIEQILSWDPELIITQPLSGLGGKEGTLYKTITTDPKWAQLQAVKNNRVYDIPDRPFNWFDRPPSINRLIGVKWLANLLYPDIFSYDLKAEIKEFYSKFYYKQLSDQEVDDLLARAKPNN